MEKQLNIFDTENIIPRKDEEECIEKICGNDSTFVERIVSNGQISPPNFWYKQALDEWLILVQGEAQLEFENGQLIDLIKGDTYFIPRQQKHRVTYTSSNPPCIWITVFGNLS